MRFRAKFQWVQAVGAMGMLVVGFISVSQHIHDAVQGFRFMTGIVQLVLGVLLTIAYAFSWWEVRDSGLTEHRAWWNRTVPWADIRHVGPWRAGSKTVYAWVAVDYRGSGLFSERGTMLVQPAHCREFVNALRDHAPQAEFDPFPFEAA
jgi:hypothetical protein